MTDDQKDTATEPGEDEVPKRDTHKRRHQEFDESIELDEDDERALSAAWAKVAKDLGIKQVE